MILARQAREPGSICQGDVNIDTTLASDEGSGERITGQGLTRARAGDGVRACNHIEWMYLERPSIPGPGLARGLEQGSRYIDCAPT